MALSPCVPFPLRLPCASLNAMLAYFDAATGTMILSAVAAGFAGGAMFFKSVWYKIAFWRKEESTLAMSDGQNPIASDGDSIAGLEIDDLEIDDSELLS